MKDHSWDNAPRWANYRTQDRDSTVYYWEEKPVRMTACWYSLGGLSQVARLDGWEDSLEDRHGRKYSR